MSEPYIYRNCIQHVELGDKYLLLYPENSNHHFDFCSSYFCDGRFHQCRQCNSFHWAKQMRRALDNNDQLGGSDPCCDGLQTHTAHTAIGGKHLVLVGPLGNEYERNQKLCKRISGFMNFPENHEWYTIGMDHNYIQS